MSYGDRMEAIAMEEVGFYLKTGMNPEGEVDWEAPGDLNTYEMVRLRSALQEIGAVSRALRAQLDKAIFQALRPGGMMRYGNNVVRAARVPKRKVRDADQLFEYLGEFLPSAVNPTYIRVTAIKEVAKQRGDNVADVMTTFFDTEWKEELTVRPVDQVPGAETMQDSEIRLKGDD